MDEDRSIDFKSLRAKFQDEGLLTRWRASRPAVAEKPRHLPPPGGHGSLVVGSINAATESNTPVISRVVFRDGLWSSGGKQSISFPPQLSSPSAQLANGNDTRQSLRHRNMPLVLPVLPLKDQKMDPAEREHKLEPGKEVSPQNKFKKKGMLLPFRSVKATKFSAENGEGPTFGDLTNRACSDPGMSPSAENQNAEDRVWLHPEQVDSEPRPSSPETLISPRPSELCVDSDNGTGSTVDRAKKFSRQQMLLSAKAKSLCSPEQGSTKNPHGLSVSTPAASCFPHLACISARPFSKANSSPWKPTFEFQLGKDKAEQLSLRTAGPNLPSSPFKKPLPVLNTLGPMAAKPPRPSVVDLTSFSLTDKGASIGQSYKEFCEHTLSCSPVLSALQFPDFEDSEVDPAVGEAVDVIELELETLDLVCADVKTPVQFDGANPEVPEPSWDPAEICDSAVVPDVNLGSSNIIPLDPARFPEPMNLLDFPEQQPHSGVSAGDTFSNSYETDGGASESQFLPEETHLREDQQDNYNGASDVYEDVENIARFISGQVSTKQKSKIKNPYADNPAKEEQYANKQPRHQWGSMTGEHAAYHVYGDQSSPNSTVYKEQRKREKRRLEKERKVQKEREKKENEMKKKFKVSGNEEPMYHAKVTVASKVCKNDLPVKSGDTVGIIRTTNCPKGKWLARDANYKYGYISVMNVELNIKEMLELGKKAQAAGRGCNKDADTISIGSRSSTHPVLTSSFSDDSEEWACEDTLSPSTESHVLQQSASEPDTSCANVEVQQTVGDTNLEDLHTQISHEALQKLAFFFQSTKSEAGLVEDGGEATPTNVETSNLLCTVDEPPYPEQEVDFSEMELLPPPPLYADNFDPYLD